MSAIIGVSIPSNGSIQFLLEENSVNDSVDPGKSQSPQTGQFNSYNPEYLEMPLPPRNCLNPLKRVNSILTLKTPCNSGFGKKEESQSPQTGQFNSYMEYILCVII